MVYLLCYSSAETEAGVNAVVCLHPIDFLPAADDARALIVAVRRCPGASVRLVRGNCTGHDGLKIVQPYLGF